MAKTKAMVIGSIQHHMRLDLDQIAPVIVEGITVAYTDCKESRSDVHPDSLVGWTCVPNLCEGTPCVVSVTVQGVLSF